MIQLDFFCLNAFAISETDLAITFQTKGNLSPWKMVPERLYRGVKYRWDAGLRATRDSGRLCAWIPPWRWLPRDRRSDFEGCMETNSCRWSRATASRSKSPASCTCDAAKNSRLTS